MPRMIFRLFQVGLNLLESCALMGHKVTKVSSVLHLCRYRSKMNTTNVYILFSFPSHIFPTIPLPIKLAANFDLLLTCLLYDTLTFAESLLSKANTVTYQRMRLDHEHFWIGKLFDATTILECASLFQHLDLKSGAFRMKSNTFNEYGLRTKLYRCIKARTQRRCLLNQMK